MNGIILIDKPKGITSFDVVKQIKNLTGFKTGHAGTLDPMATGLLVVTVGEGNKINKYLMNTIKGYIADIIFGVETSTYDEEGEVVKKIPCSFKREDIEEVIKEFVGDIEQIPPKYSALKKKGTPYYKLARLGIDIRPKPRKVKIYSLKLLKFNFSQYPTAKFEIRCSKGTYIRSLSYDLGYRLNQCGGHLRQLVRKASGIFRLEKAITLDEFKTICHKGKLKDILIDLNKALSDYPKVIVNHQARERIINGSPISMDMIISADDQLQSGDFVRGVDQKNKLLAILIWKSGNKKFIARPKRVFNLD